MRPSALPDTLAGSSRTPVGGPTDAPLRLGARYPARFRRAWGWFLGATLVATAFYALTPPGPQRDVLYVCVGLAAAVAVVAGVRTNRPAQPWAWWLMALGTFVWSSGDALGAVYTDAFAIDTFPTPADPVYLVGYGLMTAALLVMLRGRRPRSDVAGLLDSAIVTVSLGLLGWVLLAAPTIAAYRTSALAATVAALYPFADLVLLGLLVRLVTTPGGRSRSFRMLLAAVGLLVVGDVAQTALHLTSWTESSHFDFVWLLSYAVWGAAALEPSMVTMTEPIKAEPVRFTRTRLAVLAVAALVAPAVLAVQAALGSQLDVWAVVLVSVAVFGLVIARMKLSLDQIQAANVEREAARLDLAHQAAHDSLTGLANRAQAMELMRGALGRAQRSGAVVGVLFVDLDGFKQVNDTLGHGAGDEVLAIVARRMQDCVRSGDVVARFGGDEFVVLLEPVDEEASAVAVADRVVSALGEPIPLTSGREVSIGASIGVAIAQDGAVDPERLLNEADVAVYRAKVGGRGRSEVFDPALRVELDRRARLQDELVTAIAEGGLQLRHEPIVDLGSGRLAGYEAQVVWPREGAEELARAEIVPAVERTELVCDLDAWALREATRQLAAVPASVGSTTLALPVSGRHLLRPRIVTDVVEALEVARLDPARLILVVTETDLVDDARLMEHLTHVRRLGVRVCVDGFGTHDGPTDRWSRLPVDLVRIDPRALSAGRMRTSMLLRLTIETAHTFGWEVIGGGVTEPDQLGALTEIGCRYAQGPMSRRTILGLRQSA